VDGLLDTIPAELFSEWYLYAAYYEPFGDTWLQTSYICSVASNMLATKQNELLDLDTFVPKVMDEVTKPKNELDEGQLAALYG
tara:strand:- start:1601 stop:1849 length:249 start_codon:yes stop_codon:yes gene_type:complete